MRPYYGHPPACTCVACQNKRLADYRESVRSAPHRPIRQTARTRITRQRKRRRPVQRAFLWSFALLIVVTVTVIAWPVDSYGEGPFWNLKSQADNLIRDEIIIAFNDYKRQAAESEQARQEQRAESAALWRTEVEAEIIRLTNEQRAEARRGLSRLKSDSRISKIARSHSENMMRQSLVEHTLDGRDSNDRASRAGYNCKRDLGGGRYIFGLAENIAMRSPYSGSADQVAKELVDQWMSSSGHRENILDSDYRRIGVGIATSGSTIYATQNFSPCR